MSLVKFRGKNHPQQTGKRGALDEVDDRGTHPTMFDPLQERFGFTLDVAAAPHNAKCERYYTRADDGLSQSWPGRVWCNPPYSDLNAWVKKAWEEWEKGRKLGLCGALQAAMGDAPKPPTKLIVMLVPANRPEQGWWQDHVEPFRDQRDSVLRTEFLRGRTRFIKPGQTDIGPNERPPFGCALLIWQDR